VNGITGVAILLAFTGAPPAAPRVAPFALAFPFPRLVPPAVPDALRDVRVAMMLLLLIA
jgi:hypothetical protein